MLVFFFKLTRQVCNQLCLNSIKTCTQNAYFLQKVDLCIFEPKNREVIENSYKAPLSFGPLQYTYLGKTQGLVRNKEIEKWLLRTMVQCRHFQMQLFCRRFKD